MGEIQDLPKLAAIEWEAAALFPEVDLPRGVAQPASPEELRAAIAEGLLWVAEAENDEVVGFAICSVVGPFLHIAEMDVQPAHGRRGIGTALLQHVVSIAAHRQLRTVTLTTFRHLPWNAPFYAKHGFTTLESGGGIEHLEQALAAESARGVSNRVAMARGAA